MLFQINFKSGKPVYLQLIDQIRLAAAAGALREGEARHRSRNAFTLTELLIVVAIIGILASLVLTAVHGARRKAASAQCASNLRQQYLGLQHFVSEKGVYPLGSTLGIPGEYSEHEGGWMGIAQSGISEVPKDTANRWVVRGIWNCPSHKRPSISESHFSYGYNSEGLGVAADETSLGLGGHYVRRWTRSVNRPISETEVVVPSAMLFLGDGVTGWKEAFKDGDGILWRSPTAQNQDFADKRITRRVNQRHSGRINVEFCDGHVEAPTLEYLFSNDSDAALRKWNRDNQPHRERLPR